MNKFAALFTSLLLLSCSVTAQANVKVRLLLDWFVNPNHAALLLRNPAARLLVRVWMLR
ncbi:hypothetical protein O3W44_00420 [Pantoea sp. LMR881]|uniref:hypothetical protein n=1 Tax=Pantoea sp. LMR881 TaxID=3014336 RepID=UPI0022AEC109|nr:hypothetical protein [Pantoea sp. LMR881]MCZ4057863.1 hypothetical protein [Pantoea sp. LMR881]